jgi:xanthine dehydrogenase accessory factor
MSRDDPARRASLAVFLGAGDLATAAGRRLRLAGYPVVHLESERPTALRRGVTFATAVYEGSITVEGDGGPRARPPRGAGDPGAGRRRRPGGPRAASLQAFRPDVLVDGRMTKGREPLFPTTTDAARASSASVPASSRVGTSRRRRDLGPDLGRVIVEGSAPDSGVPGSSRGSASRGSSVRPRTGLRSAPGHPATSSARETVAEVDASRSAATDGVLRGLLHGDRSPEAKVGTSTRGIRALLPDLGQSARRGRGGPPGRPVGPPDRRKGAVMSLGLRPRASRHAREAWRSSAVAGRGRS